MKRHVLMFAVLLGVVLVLPASPGMAQVSVGDNAPDFTASSTHGEIQLSMFKGKRSVVLAFYFADFTRV